MPTLGPDAPVDERSPIPTIEQAYAYCRDLATSHYENFSVLSSLVPDDLRDDFAAVYAFCRWADDLGDETGHTPEARALSERLLGWWGGELLACFDDRSGAIPVRHPVFVALRATRQKFPHLSRQPFADLIDAFVQDQRIARYDTWEQLLDYCQRSANPVGRIVLTLGGYAPPEVDPANRDRYAMSDATCTALQLINFWQDVRRDLLERDRVYIPAHGPDGPTGITADLLRVWIDRPNDPAARVAYIRAVRPLVEHTAELFAQGRDLPRQLNRRIGPVVGLFGAGGDAILYAVERSGCATLWNRPKLAKMTKLLLVAQAWCRAKLGSNAG